MTDAERAARMKNEAAAEIPGEILRTAFAISARHILTAWHCTTDSQGENAELWFRLREATGRQYIYIPVRVSNYDTRLDIAALAIDFRRLSASLTIETAERALSDAMVTLSTQVSLDDQIQLRGFPASNTSADSDTIGARLEDAELALGDSTGLKLYADAFAAGSPVNPHGLSGSPVLRISAAQDSARPCAVGVVRAVPVGSLPHAAVGGSIVATRMADLVGFLPEATAAHAAIPRTELASPVSVPPHGNFLDLMKACHAALIRTIVKAKDSEHGEIAGWTHFFDERDRLRPTAISTAYGLKLALTIDAADGLLDRSALAETLWSLRLPDGGWAARTSTGYISRPETSALVLGALTGAGYNPARLEEAGEAFENSLSSKSGDRASRERTYVACAIIRGLVRARPASNHLPEFKSVLLDGAIVDPADQNLTCWGQELELPHQAPPGPTPSVVHTAMAIVALTRANLVLPSDDRSNAAIAQAVQWLCHHPILEKRNEPIRRPVGKGGQQELLGVDHFTAAWVARALLATPEHWGAEVGALLPQAMQRVCQTQQAGVWRWETNQAPAWNNQPVWMTYQGIRTLSEYSVITCSPEF